MTSLSLPPIRVAPCPLPLLRARELPHPERALRRGELVQVRRGIYAPSAAWRALQPWDRYLARVHAAALVLPDPVFCHESAAALIGLPIFGDPGAVHILRDPGGSAGIEGDVRTHTAEVPRELVDLDGIIVTSPTETVVDIARLRHQGIALATADAALRIDPMASVESVVAANEARQSTRGRRHARWSLHRASPLAESTLESVSRAAVEWLGLAEPALQCSFTGVTGDRDRCDMHWADDRVIGEADGDLKYDGRFGDPVAALRARRRRDARLREHVRSVAHWAWDDVQDFTRLRSILLGAGVRRTQPENTAALVSLGRALRGIPTARPDLGAQTVW